MDAVFDTLSAVLPYAGWLFAAVFLLLGMFLIYAMFIADRPKKEKGAVKKGSESWFARDGDKAGAKGRLVAKGKKVSKDEAAQSVYSRPAATNEPASGFSFGGSAPVTPGEGFTLPPAIAEPSPTQSLPPAPAPGAGRPGPALPPRIRKP